MSADIRWNPTEEAWQVAFARLDQTWPPQLWMVLGDPDQPRDELMAALRAYGIRKMSLDERDRDA